jgi:hypothetical protein
MRRLFALLWIAGAASAGATPPGPTPARIDRPPRIDGRIDDAAWRDAQPASAFVDYLPEPGRAPTQATEVRIAYDATALYFAFRCHDTHPGRIRSRLARRDAAFDDDWVGVILDPRADGRGAAEMMVNPHGCVMDALVAGDGRGDDVSVDYPVRAAATRDSAGWSAEMAIPFAGLGVPGARRVACFVVRQIRRTGERASLPAIEAGRRDWLAGACRLDLAPAAETRSVSLSPVLTVQRSGISRADERARVGLTAGCAPAAGLAVAVALAPDFSHVEADAPQVTLNQRFPVALPEKRAFFLEGRDAFEIAAEGGELAAVFRSRAIVRPAAGVRLTGRAGGASTLGLLCAWDDAAGERERVVWGRYARALGAARVGGLVGARDGAGARARIAGVDVDLPIGRAMRTAAHALISRAAGERGHAIAWRAGWSGAARALDVAYQEITPRFRAVTGFLRRRDVREASADGAWHFYPRVAGCRRLTARARLAGAWNSAGAPGERAIRLTLRGEAAGPSALQLSRTLGAEWCGGARFAADAWELTAESAALPGLRLALGAAVAATPIYAEPAIAGRSRELDAAVTVRPSPWLSASFEWTEFALRQERDRVSLPAARALRARLELQPERRLHLRAILDRASDPRSGLVDLLASFTLAPDAALQFGWGAADGVRQRAVFFKAAYGVRF